jgi:hypothetical protein
MVPLPSFKTLPWCAVPLRAHLEDSALDNVELRGCEACVSLLDEDITGLDTALVGVGHDLLLREPVELVEEQEVAEGVLHACRAEKHG